MRTLRTLAALLVVAATWLAHASAAAGQVQVTPAVFYVATDGNDSWSGTLPAPNSQHTDGPFASLARAQLAVRKLAGTAAVTVEIRAGTYYLPLSPTNPGKTLSFSAQDSGTAALPITWENYPGETPVVSGGEPIGSGGLGLTWISSTVTGTNSTLWQVTLPATVKPFEYLFYTNLPILGAGGGPRRLRSRIESPNGVGYYMNGNQCIPVNNPLGSSAAVATSFCNLGTYLRVANIVSPSSPYGAGCPSVTDSTTGAAKCLDRFYYNSKDPITEWINLNGVPVPPVTEPPPPSPCQPVATNPYPVGDIELTLTEAWTVDAMRIGCIDTTQHIIYLTGPTKGNAGVYNYFGPGVGKRYIIENAKDAFTAAANAGQTDLWFLDRSTSQPVLYYIGSPSDHPNSDLVVIPQLGGAIVPGPTGTDYVGGGSLISATNLSYVTFLGITFEVDNFVPSPTGFNNDINGELSLPQAIDCEGCQHVTFDTVTVQDTSASGILIASSSTTAQASNDVIQNSTFYDIGDSGVRIGHTPQGSDTATTVVTNVTVQNNLIQGYSRVFADGEGIAQGNGNNISYLHNDILDGYHAGISVCQIDCPGAAQQINGSYITSEYNHIRNIMQGITSDGGTLYYNVGGAGGSGKGNMIASNVVHDTSDSSIIDPRMGCTPSVPGSGYGGHGIYLDAQSSGVEVEYNVVYRVSGYTLFMTEGPAIGWPGNTFTNNILSLGIQGMFGDQNPWPQDCWTGTVATLNANIFNFDLNESGDCGFFVQGGCTNSCGQTYSNFQGFEGNAYWRAGTSVSGYPLFCDDSDAFHLLTNPSGSSCPLGPNTYLTFDTPPMGNKTWQYGVPPGTRVAMDEDVNPMGTCSWNPNFGTTGAPSDYLLSSANLPPTPFNYLLTNTTINMAGRESGPHSLATAVPATFPTYVYTSF